jgi:hypothetical protein
LILAELLLKPATHKINAVGQMGEDPQEEQEASEYPEENRDRDRGVGDNQGDDEKGNSPVDDLKSARQH